MDDFDIGPDEIAMFMGMAEEMAEEERERLRIEREFESLDEEESELKDNHIQPEYQSSHPGRMVRRDPFMQWVWDLSHGKKDLDDPRYGPPKPRKGKRGSKEDYTKTIILGVPIINAHLISENFLRFIHIALHYFPKHEIDSIKFDRKGQPVFDEREVFGIFNASSRSIVINLRYHFNNAVHIVEHGHTNFSMHAIIWNSMIEVFLHELWHALDTIGDPDLIYPENKDIDDIATGWAQELMTFLAQNENIEPPKLTEDPYFGVRIIKYINRVIAEGRHLWAETQREMMSGGVYYRNTQAEIEITSLKDFTELSLQDLTTDEMGSRLRKCVKKESDLEDKSWQNEEQCEQSVKEAVEKGCRLKIDNINSKGFVTKNRTIRLIGIFYKNGYGYLKAFCELKKAERTFRIDRIQSYSIIPLLNETEKKKQSKLSEIQVSGYRVANFSEKRLGHDNTWICTPCKKYADFSVKEQKRYHHAHILYPNVFKDKDSIAYINTQGELYCSECFENLKRILEKEKDWS